MICLVSSLCLLKIYEGGGEEESEDEYRDRREEVREGETR